MFESDGSPRMAPLFVYGDSISFEGRHADDFFICPDESGGFRFIWETQNAAPHDSIVCRHFNTEGETTLGPWQVNTSPLLTIRDFPRGVSTPNGEEIVVIGQGARNTGVWDNGSNDLFARRVSKTEGLIGDNWRVNNSIGDLHNEFDHDVDLLGQGTVVFHRCAWGCQSHLSIDISHMCLRENIGFYLTGDCDFDGRITVGDLNYLVACLFQGGPPPQGGSRSAQSAGSWRIRPVTTPPPGSPMSQLAEPLRAGWSKTSPQVPPKSARWCRVLFGRLTPGSARAVRRKLGI